jgi:hypothetical protein
MARGGARAGAGRPKKPAAPKEKPAIPQAPRLPPAPRGGARPGAGRPMSKKFAPTSDQRGNVEAMTGFGISQEEICRLIHNPETGKPIDKKTLELHFADEIATGQTKANATVMSTFRCCSALLFRSPSARCAIPASRSTTRASSASSKSSCMAAVMSAAGRPSTSTTPSSSPFRCQRISNRPLGRSLMP